MYKISITIEQYHIFKIVRDGKSYQEIKIVSNNA